MTKARDLATSGPSTGLVLIKPSSVVNGTDNGNGVISFSAASSVSLNDVFSATYDNYRIIITGSSVSTVLNWQMKMRASGTDSTTGYYSSEFWVNPAGSTGVGSYINNGGFFQINTNDNTNTTAITWLEVNRPFSATNTSIAGQGQDGSSGKSKFFGGQHNVTTSYDGFSILASTGNITGTISVYGYKK